MEVLDCLSGYRFLQLNEFKAPHLTLVGESPIWSQKKMLRDGAINTKYRINEIWIKKNMDRALFYQLFTIEYQQFNNVTQ